MYEIWLAVNIAWEIVVAHTAWTVPLAIVFAIIAGVKVPINPTLPKTFSQFI